MARPWFRFYRKTVNNPKAQRLRPELFKAWVNMLSVTCDNGYLPPVNDLAFALRVHPDRALTWRDALIAANLFELVPGECEDPPVSVRAHDWTDHNYDSDADPTAAERKRKSRARSRVTSDSGHANATRTDRDSELEPDSDKNSEPSLPAVGFAKAKPKTGTRWDSTRIIEKDWLSDAFDARTNRGLPPADLELEAEKFGHYWASKAGANATKLDWHRTWLAWCLKAEGKPNGMGSRTGARGTSGDTLRALAAEMGSED